MSIWESPLNQNKIDPFLERIVTDDEKKIAYGTYVLTAKKVLLCLVG